MNAKYLAQTCVFAGLMLQNCANFADAPDTPLIDIHAHQDTVFINDSTVIVASHNTLMLEHSGISDISFLQDLPGTRKLDISYTPVKNLLPLAYITDLEYLDISGCSSIVDISVLPAILDSGDRLYCLDTGIPQAILDNLIAAEVRINPPRHYIHFGHPRLNDSLNQRMDPAIERIDFMPFDAILLGGDLLRNTTQSRSHMDYLESILDLDNPATLWSLGNHDIEFPDLIPEYTKRPRYYAYSKHQIVYINFDTQDSYASDGSNNIIAEQLEMLRTLTDTLQNSVCLIVLTHKLIWMYDSGEMQSAISSVANASACEWSYCTNPNNFYTDVYPLLLGVKKRGIHVICIAGDIGNNVHAYSSMNADGIEFIGSGLGPGKNDAGTPNQVVVIAHDVISGSVSWSYWPADDVNNYPFSAF